MIFVCSSDWQLGMRRWFLEGEAQARFDQARLEAARRVGEIAGGIGADFVLVAGDVFESNQVGEGVVRRAVEVLRGYEAPVFLLAGNHDPLDGGAVWRSPVFLDRLSDLVTVLEPGRGYRPVPGVEVRGAPWLSRKPVPNPLIEVLEGLEAPDGIRVMVGHGGVPEIGGPNAGGAELPLEVLERAAGEGLFHFLALGDRHSLTEVGTSGRVWYSGTPEVTDFVERRPGTAISVDLPEDGGPPRVEVHQIGTWKFEESEVRIRDAGDVERFLEDLESREGKERTVLKLVLDLWGEAEVLRGFERALEDWRGVYGALFTSRGRSRWRVRRPAKSAEELGLRGIARDVWEELGRRAEGESRDARIAAEALFLFQDLATRQ